MEEERHNPPCDSVKSLRNWMIGALTIQSAFVMGSMMIAVSTQSSLGNVIEKQVQVIERQKITEEKADNALQKSAEALTLSGRADANIQWIREGLTEVKMQLHRLDKQP
jgi:hypothetical protein